MKKITNFFNLNNIIKILIIFLIGFTYRILIYHCLGINVFLDYTHSISILYYLSLSSFSVYIDQLFSFQYIIPINIEPTNNVIKSFDDNLKSTLLFNKDYYEYSNIIYNNLCPDKFTNKIFNINSDVKLTNPFNRLLFVVQDKETLLKNISDKGYIVSPGPKPWRGQINSLNSFLNYLDTDYRKSLYNHSILHYDKGNLNKSWKDEILTKKHFTFRNIHQNLGNIKW